MCGNHPMILKNAKINSNYMYSPTYFVTIMPVIYFYEKGNQKWFSFHVSIIKLFHSESPSSDYEG